MQYEIVILEMLTRIKKLEDEVELLKQRCAEELTVNEVENMDEEASMGESSGGNLAGHHEVLPPLREGTPPLLRVLWI